MNYGDSDRAIAECPSPASVARIRGRSLPHSITTVAIVDNSQTASNPQPYGSVAKMSPPARWLDAAQTIGAALSTKGDQIYAITRNGTSIKCECKGFHYRGECRHTAELAALITTKPRFMCAACGQIPAPDGKYLCTRCADAALAEWRASHAAALAALPPVQPSTTAEISASARVYAETLAELPAILAAERNAAAAAAHTFEGTGTRLASTLTW